MRSIIALSAAFVTLALSAMTTGCSSDDTSSSSSSSGTPPATGCAADTRKDIFAKGLSKPAGDLSIKLADAQPGPPAKGMNTLMIEIVDAAGKPVDGATITVTPFMPDHGHGSAVKPVVTPSSGGKYEVSKVYLAMAGLWKLTVTVQMPGGPINETAFQFCLDG
jgi:hypothetical protein